MGHKKPNTSPVSWPAPHSAARSVRSPSLALPPNRPAQPVAPRMATSTTRHCRPLCAAMPRAPTARPRNCSTCYFPPGTPCINPFKLASPTHPELGPIFDASMTSMIGHETTAMLDAYYFTGINVLADVGGGNGSLLSAVLARYPNMKGILFDLGHVAGRAKENLKAASLADRCSVLEGSFFETIPVAV